MRGKLAENSVNNLSILAVELGGIFTQLAHMVKEQEEMVQRIDSNVEDTALNVDRGHNEILKSVQQIVLSSKYSLFFSPLDTSNQLHPTGG